MGFETKIKVAGVTFKNDDGTRRQDLLGVLYDDFWTEGYEEEIRVVLKPDPENRYDPNAVKVVVKRPKEARGCIGFVPAEHAEFVGGVIRQGKLRSVEIDNMGNVRGGTVYARLALKLHGEEDSPEDEDDGTIEDEDGRVYEFD